MLGKYHIGAPDGGQGANDCGDVVRRGVIEQEAPVGNEHAIDEFVRWYCSEPRLAFNRTVVFRYRIHLEQRAQQPLAPEPASALH